jgi:hypothetical protein
VEISCEFGMAGDGSGYLQNAVTETQTAALGFRVKSGSAVVVCAPASNENSARR